MRYYMKRYCHGMARIRRWLPVVLLPPLFYLLAVSASPDRFTVIQKIAVQKAAPIALSRTPVDVMPMAEMTSRPAELFLESFALLDLGNAVPSAPGLKNDGSRNLKGLIESGMTLKAADDASVLLGYYGDDVEMGKMLVTFYTQRLVSRSKDGLVRSTRNLARAGVPETTGVPAPFQTARPGAAALQSPPAAPEGEMHIQEHSTFWRPDRLFPSVGILAVSLVIWFILAGFAEWTDPSFKTERQVSRYLDLPVIGVMPDLDPLIQLTQAQRGKG